MTLRDIHTHVVLGAHKVVEHGAELRLIQGVPPNSILNEALILAIGEAGSRLEC
jgi:hypothetical protein